MTVSGQRADGALLERSRAAAERVLPVTVVIPAYGREALIERALRSVAAQSAQPAEVVVVDDCSPDGTGDVARSLGARVIRHDENRGEGAARNTGVEAAGEEWIALLDSDDEWLPHALATLWDLRDRGVLVSGAWLAVYEDGSPTRYGGTTRRRPERVASPARLVYPENYLCASAMLARRADLVAAGGYRPLPRAADMDLCIRLLERGPGIATPEVVAIYHFHSAQATADKPAMRAAHEQVASDYADRDWCTHRLVERARAVTAWDGLRQGLRAGRRRQALAHAGFILRRPRRIAAVAGICARRLALKRLARRRSALLDGRSAPPPSGAAG